MKVVGDIVGVIKDERSQTEITSETRSTISGTRATLSKPLALSFEELNTPLGTLVLAADTDGALRVADWAEYRERTFRLLNRQYGVNKCEVRFGAVPKRLKDAVRGYFAGHLDALNDLPVATGGTAFQNEVWTALRTVPAGQTLSYSELAAQIGRPKATRAAGLANGANPIGIVVPCHRVIGVNGTLTGYGGGLERKRWLLAHEAAALKGISV